MSRARNSVKALARIATRRAGFEVINLKHNRRFGWDWMRDVARLVPLIGARMDTIFDVGANDGQTALELREAFPEAHLHCFEPTPSTHARLTGRLAGMPRLSLYPVALGATAGTAVLHCFESSLLNTLAADAPFIQRFPGVTESATGQVEASVRTIDEVCRSEKIDRISLLKIDTEGFELEVLRGAEGMLTAGKIDFIVAEITDAAPLAANQRGNLVSLIELLHPHGFRFVSTFTDGVAETLPFYLLSNALFVRASAATAPMNAAS